MANRPSPGNQESYSHEQIKELLELVARLHLEEIELESRDFRLRIVGHRPAVAAPAPVYAAAPVASEVVSAPAAAPAAPAAAPAPAEDTAKYTKVTSPMIGTFYSSPAPDAPPFVSIGDHVDENSVLCIIEAMKLMNEIKAETRGVLRRVLVENGQPVEYGQPLFLIEPQ